MANFISWGVVYCSSYFGDEDYNTRTLTGDGVPACFDNAFTYAEKYSVRVVADGGTVEAFACLVDAIDRLNYN
jgi:hypothetical protein